MFVIPDEAKIKILFKKAEENVIKLLLEDLDLPWEVKERGDMIIEGLNMLHNDVPLEGTSVSISTSKVSDGMFTSVYQCTCPGEGYECAHIKEAIENRKDVKFYEELMRTDHTVAVVLPVIYGPVLLHPFVFTGDSISAEICHPGFSKTGHASFNIIKSEIAKDYLTTIVAGEGGAAILASFQDSFSQYHASHAGVEKRYMCRSRRHSMKRNNAMRVRMEDKELRGPEMVRVTLTGSCTECFAEEARAIAEGATARDAFGDLVPRLTPEAKPFMARPGRTGTIRPPFPSGLTFPASPPPSFAGTRGDTYRAPDNKVYEHDGKEWRPKSDKDDLEYITYHEAEEAIDKYKSGGVIKGPKELTPEQAMERKAKARSEDEDIIEVTPFGSMTPKYYSIPHLKSPYYITKGSDGSVACHGADGQTYSIDPGGYTTGAALMGRAAPTLLEYNKSNDALTKDMQEPKEKPVILQNMLMWADGNPLDLPRS